MVTRKSLNSTEKKFSKNIFLIVKQSWPKWVGSVFYKYDIMQDFSVIHAKFIQLCRILPDNWQQKGILLKNLK